MLYRRIMASVAAAVLAVTLSGLASANTLDESKTSDQRKVRVIAPLNIAILIQDDLISRVGNELGVTRDFIRSLPQGSRVMIGYVTSGTLQVRQPFTGDLDKAARSLRIPISNSSASPYNPYVEVIEALRNFDHGGKGKNVVLLISDGLDTSRGFDITSAGHTLDLERAIGEAS